VQKRAKLFATIPCHCLGCELGHRKLAEQYHHQHPCWRFKAVDLPLCVRREAARSRVWSGRYRDPRRSAGKGRRVPIDARQGYCDPLAAKQAARKTFGQCADELIKSKRREWRSEVHAAQWSSTLNDYCGPIRDLAVDEIDTQAVLAVLQPLWSRIPETASRLRGRVEAVLDYAKAHGWRSGENPAAWRGHLALILPRRQKLTRGHHAAMPYADVPAFLATLREREAIAALALEFLILTAARAGEVLGARWAEFDLEGKVWTVPAARMKAGIEHRIPLSTSTMAIVARMAEIRSGDLVFPGQRRGRPVSGMSLGRLCSGAGTVHGFRSAFRDWAGNETNFPREICEAALAHAVGSAVEQAYRRSDALERRRALMGAWASYCALAGTENVIPMRTAK
jgi:integrase